MEKKFKSPCTTDKYSECIEGVAPEYLTWKFELKVSKNWVMDGFDLNGYDKKTMEDVNYRIAEVIRETMLGYAYEHEVKAKLIAQPESKIIKELQNGKLE